MIPILLGFLVLGCSIPIAAQVDEAALFQSDSIVPVLDAPSVSQPTESTTITGRIWSYTFIPIPRRGDIGDSPIYNSNQVNLLMDTRLKNDAKAFVNFEVSQFNSGTTSSLNVTLREAFIDFNFDRMVYIRSGKQVLKWGRSFFWNPTDLISMDRQSFLRMDRYRDGVLGSRLTWPIGMDQSVTAFINYQGATLNTMSIALKYEFLVGNTEIGLSTWQRSQSVGVYGIDASTRIMGIDTKFESAWSYGSNTPKYSPSLTPIWITNDWVNRSSVTLSQAFNWELANRITISQEAFYNSHGYTDSPFATLTRIAAMQAAGHYTPNMMGQWYTATFVTIHTFPWSNTTLSINSISNLTDWSHTTGVSALYTPLDNLNLSLGLYAYWGASDGEYTANGTLISPEISLSVEF